MFKLRVCGLLKGEEKTNPKQKLTPVQKEIEMKSAVIFFSIVSFFYFKADIECLFD